MQIEMILLKLQKRNYIESCIYISEIKIVKIQFIRILIDIFGALKLLDI